MDTSIKESISRRKFLYSAGSTVLGFSLIPLTGCETNSFEPIVEGTSIPFISPVQSVTPELSFFEQYGGAGALSDWPGVQQLSRDAWSMEIAGLVGNPITINFADILRESDAAVRVLTTLRCVIDETSVPGLIGNAVWTGVPLRIFLDRAGVDKTATRRFRFFGSDGFTNNLKFEHIYGTFDDDALEPLLVYEMNNEPLKAEHGHPVRLLVPGYYGYKSVKWLTRIEATADDTVFGSYQEQLGYVDDGVVSVINKVTNPLVGQTISAGRFRIFGYALSGQAGIQSVEISFNDGPFQGTRILPLSEILSSNPEIRETLQLQNLSQNAYPFRGVWALWDFEWDATAGRHLIRVRATDQRGNTQPVSDENDLDGNNPQFAMNVNVA